MENQNWTKDKLNYNISIFPILQPILWDLGINK